MTDFMMQISFQLILGKWENETSKQVFCNQDSIKIIFLHWFFFIFRPWNLAVFFIANEKSPYVGCSEVWNFAFKLQKEKHFDESLTF